MVQSLHFQGGLEGESGAWGAGRDVVGGGSWGGGGGDFGADPRAGAVETVFDGGGAAAGDVAGAVPEIFGLGGWLLGGVGGGGGGGEPLGGEDFA
jgi:hypothetical protein